MSPRALAGPEIQRILALVPWIVAHPDSPKREIASRFGITVDQLDDDLALVLMIGVPPYSPGDYLDVEEDEDGNVSIRLADYFRRPLRLTPAEGLALLAAGRALLAVPGSDPDGPLATALAKLEDALDLPGLVVDVGEPALLEAIRDAVATHRRVEIEYWSAGRDELTTRRIDPEVVFFATGEWYVGAYCHRAQDERMFRVDRIRSVAPTTETFAPGATGFETGDVYTPRAADTRVTLDLAPAAAWVAEAYPTEAVTERGDGSLEIVLAVSEPAWLERLLLRLGPDVRVVAPGAVREGLAADAAARILRGYGAAAPPSNGLRAGPTPGRLVAHERMRPVNPITSTDSGFDRLPNREPENASDAPPEPPPRAKPAWTSAIEWFALIVAALAIVVLIKLFLFQAFYIPSDSMVPTLKTNDRVIVNKLSYRLHSVHRGDIVVFKAPPNVDPSVKDLVKRVIGLPGETIEGRSDGHIYIDGKQLHEPYLPAGTSPGPGFAPIKIPANSYWVMGDNRSNSRYSRYFPEHFIRKKDIVGRVFVRIWPLKRLGIL